jgi:hypothetical protein
MGRGNEEEKDELLLRAVFPQIYTDAQLSERQDLEYLQGWYARQRNALENIGEEIEVDKERGASEVENDLEWAAEVIETAGVELRDLQVGNVRSLMLPGVELKAFIPPKVLPGVKAFKQVWFDKLVRAAGLLVAEGQRELANAEFLKCDPYDREDEERGREIADRLRTQDDDSGARVERHKVDPQLGVFNAAKLIAFIDEGWELSNDGLLIPIAGGL